jgi:hypothetical protein
MEEENMTSNKVRLHLYSVKHRKMAKPVTSLAFETASSISTKVKYSEFH